MSQAKYSFPFQPKILAISLIGILNSLPARVPGGARNEGHSLSSIGGRLRA